MTKIFAPHASLKLLLGVLSFGNGNALALDAPSAAHDGCMVDDRQRAYKESAAALARAAAKRDPVAALALVYHYNYFAEDPALARAWLRVASGLGLGAAQVSLAASLAERRTDSNLGQAEVLLRSAVAKGCAAAHEPLAVLLQSNRGAPPTESGEVRLLLESAALRGELNAVPRLIRVLREQGDDEGRFDAAAWFAAGIASEPTPGIKEQLVAAADGLKEADSKELRDSIESVGDVYSAFLHQ